MIPLVGDVLLFIFLANIVTDMFLRYWQTCFCFLFLFRQSFYLIKDIEGN